MKLFALIFGCMIAAGAFWKAQVEVKAPFIFPLGACALWSALAAWFWTISERH